MAALVACAALSQPARALDFEWIGHLPADFLLSRGLAISGNGVVVVGDSYTLTGVEAVKWDPDSGMLGLGQLGGNNGVAFAVNFDGSVIVGSASLESGSVRAFRWDASNGMVDIGVLNPEGGASPPG